MGRVGAAGAKEAPVHGHGHGAPHAEPAEVRTKQPARQREAAADAIADANVDTSVYTPGALARAHPIPQLTMPTCTHALLASRRNIGPPESP
jgi:hypothetical protein